MPFLTPLQVQLLDDRSIFPWITLAPLEYECPLTGEVYIVPRNFRTDGASVGRALILLAPPLAMRFMGAGVWLGFKSGCLHDFLRRPDQDGNLPVPAKVAHLVFRESLYEAGYPADLCESYYQAVKLFNS
jgi:hypothetical protein